MKVGEIFQGRYEITRILGEGGMGTVFQATDLELQRQAAIKTLTNSNNPTQFVRFQQEAKTIAKLSHDNIVRIFDFHIADDSQLICIMEMLDGESLKELIDTEGSLSPEDALTISINIVNGLKHAHSRGIIHRDIKPQNVMVKPDEDSPGEFKVKLVDFGVARLQGIEAQKLTSTGASIGTPTYMSPESIRGEETNELSDIYSFGCSFYQMLTGKVPFERETVLDVMAAHLNETPPPMILEREHDLSQEQIDQLQAIFLSCVEKKPSDRYQNADALLSALMELHSEISTEESQDEHAEYGNPFVPSRKMLTIVLFILLTGIIAWLVFLKEQDKREIAQASIRTKEIASASETTFTEPFLLSTELPPTLSKDKDGVFKISYFSSNPPREILSSIQTEPAMVSLTIRGLDLNQVDTSYLSSSRISNLTLEGCSVNRECLVAFARMPALHALMFLNCNDYENDLDALADSNSLFWITVNQTSIRDDQLPKVMMCKSISCVSAGGTSSLNGTFLMDNRFRGRLRALFIDNLKSFDSKNLRGLRGQPMKNLCLAGLKLDDADLKVVSELPLESCDFSRTNVSGKIFDYLMPVKPLNHVLIAECVNIKATQVKEFRKARPSVRVEWSRKRSEEESL